MRRIWQIWPPFLSPGRAGEGARNGETSESPSPKLLFPRLPDMPVRALLYRRPAEPRSLQLIHGRGIYQVRLQRHRQARRYTLRIHMVTREAIITMPPRGTIKEARDFAQQHVAWIASRLNGLPPTRPFAHGVSVPLRGLARRIVHRRNERGTVWTESSETGERLLCVAGDAPHINRRIHDYLKREARRDIEAAVQHHAAAIGVKHKRITIRDQSSRWGSCSSNKTLSFSWRLILTPPYVLDYIVAHEVAHLVELNHSARFWRLVGKMCDQVERAKLWLDVHGNDLHRYGASDD